MIELLEEAKRHYEQLAPHIKSRETAKLLKALIDALDNQWQPIDNAPLNTKIMMYGEAIDDLVECEIGWIYKDKEVVFCSIGGFTPTHWQPLPQPPKQ